MLGTYPQSTSEPSDKPFKVSESSVGEELTQVIIPSPAFPANDSPLITDKHSHELPEESPPMQVSCLTCLYN